MAILLVVGGCRKPLAPTFDRNQAPETWITAAPLDTITYREGVVPKQTDPTQIPFRYHLYWAGSDPDGKVVGFYFAVVETLPLPIPPAVDVPPLPGPKPQDYKYTTKSDSTFIFSVSTQRKDRQHAFYIYAVDNLGRPDPTPARFIFFSYDRFPPQPVIDSFVGTGLVWEQDATTLALTRRIQVTSVPPTDTFIIGAKPKTTLPATSRLDIAWHSLQTTVDNPAVGYRYKLDEPDFINVDSTVTTLAYNTGPDDFVGPGVKIFRLQAVDRAGGAAETSRLFQMNIKPTTWFSGPDRTLPPWQHPANSNDYYVDLGNSWAAIPDLRPALLSADSVKVMPSQRPKRRTFYELYQNRIFVRQEGDTVNMNSWVVFHNGGFDPDSPYEVIYRSNDSRAPDSTTNPVLQIRPSNGSPIGFRSRIPMSLWPTGQATGPSQTALYPNFDPASVNRLPQIAGYWGMSQAGVGYLFARSEDGNGSTDDLIGSTSDLQPAAIVKAVDSTGSANATQIAVRPQIIKFFVNKAPSVLLTNPGFSPKPDGTFLTRSAVPTTMVFYDPDPFDPANPIAPGGPTLGSTVARYWLRLRAQRNGGALTDSVTYSPAAFNRVPVLPGTIALGDSLGGQLSTDPGHTNQVKIRVLLEVCDCSQCENVPGSGRCSFYSYYIYTSAPPEPQSIVLPPGAGGGDLRLVEKKRGVR